MEKASTSAGPLPGVESIEEESEEESEDDKKFKKPAVNSIYIYLSVTKGVKTLTSLPSPFYISTHVNLNSI